jgi:hypothetical protein
MTSAMQTGNLDFQQQQQPGNLDFQQQQQQDLSRVGFLKDYSVQFKVCRDVKMFSDELAESRTGSVMAAKTFVIFSLWLGISCQECNSLFREYLIDINDYLKVTVAYHQEVQESMCNACKTCGNNNRTNNNQYKNGKNGNAESQAEMNNVASNMFYPFSVECETCMDK